MRETPARQCADDSIGPDYVADSPAMKDVFARVERIADAPAPVLITGPSGAGKEIVARALHTKSSRSDRAFVAINCGALTPSLVESELFGHIKGAFTGATAARQGAFEEAHGGTLFLDEVGELPLDLQPKLLRVLETSCVRRVGSTVETPVDVRVVTATHRDLRKLVDQGKFREDLYHRLVVLYVPIPSLRRRPEDILPLARLFLDRNAGPGARRLDPDAERALMAYRWPGNVRELRNVMMRAAVMTRGDYIRSSDLEFSENIFATVQSVHGAPRPPQHAARPAPLAPPPSAITARGYHPAPPTTPRHNADSAHLGFDSFALDPDTRTRLVRVLESCGHNRAKAARQLGIAKSTLHYRLQRAGIPLKSSRRSA